MRAVATMSPGKALDRVPVGRFVTAEDLPGTRAAASSALSRARKAGDVVAIRKGLYFKGARTRYGMTKPSAEQIAVKVLGSTGVGPTGFTAARALGLTTQVPSRPALTIAGPVPTSLPGVKVSQRNNMRRRKLRYTEIALLELLRGEWEATVEGGWTALVTVAAAAVSAQRIRPSVLAEVIEGERSPTARETFIRLRAELSTRSEVVSP